MRRFTALCVLCALSAAPLPAQVRVVRHGDDRLNGIHEVDVVVLVASSNDPSCGPSRDAWQALARDTLRAEGVAATVSDKGRSWFYSVLVHVASARVESCCVTSLLTELVAEVEGIPEADRSASPSTWGSLLVGQMPLATTNALVTSTVQEHDAAVRQAVRGQLTQIAARLRAANARR